MKQWDILGYPFPFGVHPAVVISSDSRCTEGPHINVLACTSLRSGSSARRNEVILDIADGLDWATVVRCDMMHLVPKADFGSTLGQVNIHRRRQIARTIIECFRLQAF